MSVDVGKGALIAAVLANDVDAVVANKEHAGETDGVGNTGLILAAKEGNVPIVQILAPLEARTTNAYGMTALMYAAKAGHADIVEILAQREAKLLSRQGKTALMYAAANDHCNAIVHLLEHEQGMQDASGKTALMYAAKAGHEAAVATLVDSENCITNNAGKAAIHYAVAGGHAGVEAILDAEAGLCDHSTFEISEDQPSEEAGEVQPLRHIVASSSLHTGGSVSSSIMSPPSERELSVRQQASERDRSRPTSPNSISRTRDSSIAIRESTPSQRFSVASPRASHIDSASASASCTNDSGVLAPNAGAGQPSNIPMPYILSQQKTPSHKSPQLTNLEYQEIKLGCEERLELANKYADSPWRLRSSQSGAGSAPASPPQLDTAARYINKAVVEDMAVSEKQGTSSSSRSANGGSNPNPNPNSSPGLLQKHVPVAGTIPKPAIFASASRTQMDSKSMASDKQVVEGADLPSFSASMSIETRSMISQSDMNMREEYRRVTAEIHDLVKEITSLTDQIRIKEKECEVYKAQIERAGTTRKIYNDSYNMQGNTACQTKHNAEVKSAELKHLEEKIAHKQQEIDEATTEFKALEARNYSLERSIILKEDEISTMQSKLKRNCEVMLPVNRSDVEALVKNKSSMAATILLQEKRKEIARLQEQLQASEAEHKTLQLRCEVSQKTADELVKLMQQLNATASKPKGPPIPPPGAQVAIAIPCSHMIIDPGRTVRLATNQTCPKCDKAVINFIIVDNS